MADASVDQRKEVLRKKGQEFLERAITQASSKTYRSGSDVRLNIGRDNSAQQMHVDPTLETVGVVVEGLRLYIAALLFVISSAASLVLAKATLTYLNTPAAAVFLHMVAAVLVLSLMSCLGELPLGPFSWSSLIQCLPEVICSGVQTLCLFGLLYRESVYLVAIWVTLAPQVLAVATAAVSRGRRPRALQMLLLVIGVSLGGMGLHIGLTEGTLSLVFLTLWAVAELGHEMTAKALAKSGVPLTQAGPFDDPPTRQTVSLYKNALACVPVLIIGLTFEEGSALAKLELSVPTLSCLLLSCCAWGVAGSTQLVMQSNTQAGFQLLMASLSYIGIVVAQVVVMGIGQVHMLLLSLAAVTVAVAMMWASAKS